MERERKISFPTSGTDPLLYHRGQDRGKSCAGCRETFFIFAKYVLVRCFVLALYVMDILSDVNAAYGDYKAGDTIFAYVTLGLVFAPGVLFSIYLFFEYFLTYIGEIACLKAPFSLLVSPFMPLWVILRDLRLIMYGIIAAFCPLKRPKLTKRLTKPSRAYLLKFLEAFTEAAPQLLVRLFRLASRSTRPFSDLRWSEILQISFSLLTLSVKVVSTHQQSVSTQQVIEGGTEVDSKYTLPWYLQIPAILWWLCFLASRFEALALFCASYGYWVLLLVGIHILLVFFFQTIADHKDRLKRIFIYLFGAFVFIFAYVQFNLKTRVKTAVWFPYVVFTLVLFVENSIMLTFWFFDKLRGLGIVHSTISSFNFLNESSEATTFSSLNLTSEGGLSSEIEKEELQFYWKLLLYLHYGIFGVGLLFMVTVFWGVSVCTSDHSSLEESRNGKENEGNVEMQDLMLS